MARNKLRMQTLFTSMTVYGVISTLDDRVYRSNGTLEAYSAGALASYAVAAGAEEGASRAYPLTLPANLPAGVYTVDAFKRVGASPAEGDPLVYQTPGLIYWDGTNIQDAADASALLDSADAIEVGLTMRGAFRLMCAADAGKLSGAGTTTVTIRNAVADSKARITATVDGAGNRTAITWDPS